MGRWLPLVAVVSAGCADLINLERVSYAKDASVIDVDAPDGSIDGPPVGCYGSFLNICLLAGDDDDFTVPNSNTIETGQPPNDCEQVPIINGFELCVIAGSTILIDETVELRGFRPLVLIATTSLTITANGVLSANSEAGGRRGAGSNPAVICSNDNHGVGTSNSGGGGGGSFGGMGGNGGKGSGTVGGGTADAAFAGPFTDLRGGCKGGSGGGIGNLGGNGGGAVYLIGGQQLVVAGIINASGAGGLGAPSTFGGGGAGSGGMIVLDSPTLVVSDSARLIAHGGGGGGGGGSTGAGINGGDSTAGNNFTALGGLGGLTGGGDGGDGSLQGNATGDIGGSAVNGGGGGGGGGHGVIRLFSANRIIGSSSIISPAQI